VDAERSLLELRAERFNPETTGLAAADFDADDSPSGLHKLVPRVQWDRWEKQKERNKDAKSFRKLSQLGWRAATFVSCSFALVLAILLTAALVDAAKHHPALVQPEKP